LNSGCDEFLQIYANTIIEYGRRWSELFEFKVIRLVCTYYYRMLDEKEVGLLFHEQDSFLSFGKTVPVLIIRKFKKESYFMEFQNTNLTNSTRFACDATNKVTLLLAVQFIHVKALLIQQTKPIKVEVVKKHKQDRAL
jgi:hypothetical protein